MPGSNIRKIRKSKGIISKWVAAEVGISRGALSRIERNKCDPSMKTLRKIAKVLGVPMKSFFEEANFSGRKDTK